MKSYHFAVNFTLPIPWSPAGYSIAPDPPRAEKNGLHRVERVAWKRRYWQCALALVFLFGMCLLLTGVAMTHGADIKAFLAFEPAVLSPGPHIVRVELLDFYDNAVPQAKLKIDIQGQGGEIDISFDLQEDRLGLHRGHVILPGLGAAELRVEAILPDGPWRGQARLTVNNELPKHVVGLALRHADAPLVTPLGVAVFALLGIVIVAGVTGIGFEIFRFRRTRAPVKA